MNHLGGHNNITSIDLPMMKKIKDDFEIRSCLDIGCGPGDMESICKNLSIEWTGIDGDFSIKKENILMHDFTKSKLILDKEFDLAWSVEFLEHVEEIYLDNFMPCFSACSFVLITAALPNSPGHHHVNCKENSYWIDIFEKHNFKFLDDYTNELKVVSTMRKHFFKRSGMFFKKIK
jgi:SAM-dependent methyltransferase